MPIISVIMGVYNCTDFDLLRKSVESIINQTFTDWEFIICNDGSTNDTLDELKKLAVLDNRIKIISYSDNKGLEYALNSCLNIASGKYIARQDDDDYSTIDRLEKQYTFLEEHNEYQIVSSCMKVFDDDGVYGRWTREEKPQKKDFLWTSQFSHSAAVMKTDALKKVGGYRIAKEISRLEDYDLFMRMYAAGMKGYNIQEDLYYYRVVRSLPYRYRSMRDRINEAKVRFYGFRKMGILFLGIPFIIKPIIVGLIPVKIFNRITENKYKNQ